MSGLIVTITPSENCFKFNFSSKNFNTCMNINNPFGQSEAEWTKLIWSITNNKYYHLEFESDQDNSCGFAEIECGKKDDSFELVFTSYPDDFGGIEINITINLDRDRDTVLKALNSLLQNPDVVWK